MRLWSIHPKYLDAKGLVALWREGLLALAVLEGKTNGYRNHPQLERFRAEKDQSSHHITHTGAVLLGIFLQLLICLFRNPQRDCLQSFIPHLICSSISCKHDYYVLFTLCSIVLQAYYVFIQHSLRPISNSRGIPGITHPRLRTGV